MENGLKPVTAKKREKRVETWVTTNSPSQDFFHSDDQIQLR